MKNYVFVADCHKYGVRPIKIKPDYLTYPDLALENVISVGDNFDKRHCKLKYKEQFEKELFSFQEHFRNRFVTGNHELRKDNLFLVLDKHILVTHGDSILNKCPGYRDLSPYKGHSFLSKFLAVFSFMKISFISKKKKEILAKTAKSYGCDTIVIGHIHPHFLFDKKYKNVRILILPQGLTEVVL